MSDRTVREHTVVQFVAEFFGVRLEPIDYSDAGFETWSDFVSGIADYGNRLEDAIQSFGFTKACDIDDWYEILEDAAEYLYAELFKSKTRLDEDVVFRKFQEIVKYHTS
jgi:hypothetical protein